MQYQVEEVSTVESASVMHDMPESNDGPAADHSESSAPSDDTYRSHFAAWLGGMSEEARQLAFLLEREEASAPLRRLAADSLNQLLHAADMLPEGTEALGYLETCFAFRLLAAEQSEAAYSAPRLPRPRLPKPGPPKVAPAEAEHREPAEPPAAEGAAADLQAADLQAEVAEDGADELATAGAAPEETKETDGAEVTAAASAAEVEAAEAVAADAVGADGERVAVPLPAAPEEEAPAAEDAQTEVAQAGAEGAEVLAGEAEEVEAVAAEPAPLEEEPEEEPERAQASDESYAVVRRLAPQAALVRAFLGADDAERLRRLVLEHRGRASRGRSSKEILLEADARSAAASDARDWAELYEAPEFGSTQHDLLRLRTFMRTRVRRGAS